MSVTTSMGGSSSHDEIDLSGIKRQPSSNNVHSRIERDCHLDNPLPAFDTLTDVRWMAFRQENATAESIRRQLSLDSKWVGVIQTIIGGEQDLGTNLIRAGEVSDEIRAALLWEFLRSIQNVCPNPRLIPLKEGSKEPKIVGRCSLNSDEATEMLHTPSEAVDALRDGHPGFALYAGKECHNTENVVLIDHDDMEVFELDTLPETLTVRSGSGGFHELFVTPDHDDIRNSRGEWGEVRSHNWHCCVPGSIHESGSVYHISGLREPSILVESDVPEQLEPSSGNGNGSSDREFNPDHDLTLSTKVDEYENELGISLKQCRQHDPKLDAYFNNPYPDHVDTRDDSQIEAKLVWRLRYNYFSDDRIYDILPHRPRGRKEWKSYDEAYIHRTVIESPTPEWRFTSADYANENDSPQYLALLPDINSLSDNFDEDTTIPTLEDAWDRRDDILRSVLNDQRRVLVDGIPSIGKSYGIVKVAAETETPLIIFTARHDLYEQYEQWCAEHELDCYTLGSFHHDCETANGTHGEEWKEAVTDLYDSNVTGSEIHKYAEQHFGKQLPCDRGQECSWKTTHDFNSDGYDVLVGHYTHAHNETLLENRTAVIDESCGDAFTEKYQQGTVSTAVNNYVKGSEIIPFNSYVDLTENRNDPEKKRRVEGAKEWFIEEQGIERDSSLVLDGTDRSADVGGDECHADAPLLTYTLLAGQDMGNGVEYTLLGPSGMGSACRNRTTESIHIRRPPDLSKADGVICLDGTPSQRMWESSIGEDLERIQVLSDTERTGYLTNEYGLTVIQTSDTPKPYSAKHRNYLTPEKDAHYLNRITEETGRDPPVITPNQALLAYRKNGIMGAERRSMNFAQTKSSNEFDDEELGIVLGSTHYGDGSIKEECALQGERVERVSNTKGNNLRYTTELGNEVLEAQRESRVFQAIMRYGRKTDKNPTTFVHSSALPDWVPVTGEGDVIEVSDGMREVLYAIAAIDREPQFDDTFSTKNIAHRVNIGENSARNHLETLMEYGYLEKDRPKNAIQWTILRLPFDPFSSNGESSPMIA